MILTGLICFALLALTVVGLCCSLLSNLRSQLVQSSRAARVAFVILVIIVSAILLRPHEDTFAGLDNSGYRLMARAFQAGRPMHGVDKLLLETPHAIRNNFMLLPTMDERNSRDRSFLVKSLDTCETEPFFYPLLPLCAIGFDALMPGDALDYLVPVIGLIFAVIFLLTGAAYGGSLGVVLAGALLAGSPLPAWLLRGFYVESVSSVLLSLALLDWLTCAEGTRVSRFAYLSLGLAVSFHPAMVVIALPLLMFFILSLEERLSGILTVMVYFCAGFAVMVIMFTFACSPYGSLRPSSLIANFLSSASHRITLAFGGIIAAFILLAAATKPVWTNWYNRLSESGKHVVTSLPAILSILPLLYSAMAWSQKEFVCRGIVEAVAGVRLWLGILLAISVLHIFISRSNGRARIALMVVFLCVPVFAYLKGAEQMGLWSQRRLLPVYLVLASTILPSAGSFVMTIVRQTPKPMNLVAGIVALAVMMLAGITNPVRWPAPYTVCCDGGAWEWVENIRSKIWGKLVFFDYYPFSVPFAVTGNIRVLGLCERAQDKVPEIIHWLVGKASAKDDVLIATAYENPGVEEGLSLKESFSDSFRLRKIASKGPLPAEKRMQPVKIRFLKASPVTDDNPLPVLNKVLDDGPLAIRGNWGRGSFIKVDSRLLPSRWSREGSGVIGPVPLPGKKVQIRIEAAASRDDGVAGQIFRIVPPWNGNAITLAVSNDFCIVSGEICRPSESDEKIPDTGLYRIYSNNPYDPAKSGIRGYENDLGARIHRIRIEAITSL